MKLQDITPTMTQRYRLRMSEDNFENARPGQFVHRDNDTDEVSGFISAVDKDRYELEICTFEQIEAPKAMLRSIADRMTMDECAVLLRSITEQDPDIHEAWVNLVNQ